MTRKKLRFESAFFILSNINKKRKLQLLLILPIIILGSLAESISILAVIPFILNLVNKNNSNYENVFFNFLNNYLPNNLNDIFIFLLSIIMTSILFRFASIYSYNYWVALVGADISYKSFKKLSSLDYPEYKKIVPVKITNLLLTSVNNTIASIDNYLVVFVGLITSLGFLITGLIVNTKYFILIFFILVISYSLIILYSKGILKKIGFIQQQYVQNAYSFINYTFGTFKDIKLENSSKFIDNLYFKNEFVRRINGSRKKLISLFPKIIIEGFAILLIAFIINYLSSNKQYTEEIGVEILLITLIFSRLLPVFQLIFSSWSSIRVHRYSVLKLKEFYQESKAAKNIKIIKSRIKFFNSLELIDLSFSYNKNNKVFENLNFKINKGEWIGICGKSGSGKSTLLDLMMGLLKSSEGQILVNKKDINKSNYCFSWRNLIAHCPPETYLMDTDIISNIKPIYDQNELDYEKLKKAWHCAALDEFLSLEKEINLYNYKKNYLHPKTKLFSSGQRQRIVIARTLYKDKEILFLDEFTSSLDNKIEKIIVKRIKDNYPEKTVILISHRKNPLQFCDKLIKL